MLLVDVTPECVAPGQKFVAPFDGAANRTRLEVRPEDMLWNAPNVDGLFLLALQPLTGHLRVGRLPFTSRYGDVRKVILDDVLFDAFGSRVERQTAAPPLAGEAACLVNLSFEHVVSVEA